MVCDCKEQVACGGKIRFESVLKTLAKKFRLNPALECQVKEN